MYKRGLTKTEVLVVVMSIGVLLVSLDGMGVVARESSRRVVCQANLQRLAGGFHRFANDKGMFPTDNNMSLYYVRWTGDMIDPSYWVYYYQLGSNPAYDYLKLQWCREYVDDLRSLECPSDVGDLGLPAGHASYYGALGCSYWYNCRDLGGPDPWNDLALGSLLNRPVESITNPEEAIVLGDPEIFAAALGPADELRWRWHNQEQNLAYMFFVDGHVAGHIMEGGLQGDGWNLIAEPDF